MTDGESWGLDGAESRPPHAGGGNSLVAILLAVLVVLTVSVAAAGIGAAQTAGNDATPTEEPADPTPTETPTEAPERSSSSPSTSSTSSASDPTVQELRRGGEQISGAAPSMRWLSDDGSVYVDYEDPNPLVGGTGEDWEAGEILEPGELVESDDLRLHAQRARDAGNDKYRLHITYAELVQETEERGNSTVTVTRARNVTTQSQNVTFTGPFDTEEVDLRRSEGTRQVLMVLEEPDSGKELARYSFRHRSVATTQAAGINTMGDLLAWVGWWIAFPLIVLTIVVGVGARWAVQQAGKGPDKGVVFWSITGGTTTFFAVLIGYVWLADWLVAVPLAIPVALALVMGIVYLESWEVGVEEVEFIKPELELATSPSGERSVDMVSVESTKEKVVSNGPSDLAVVRDGIRPFLSRCFGGAAPLIGGDDLATRFDVTGEDSDHDAKVFVHPKSGSVLDYQAEGWQLSLPPTNTRGELLEFAALTAVALVFTAGVWTAFSALWGSLAFAGVVLLIALRPEEGYAQVHLAPAHTRAAFASMLYLARETDDADTIESARRKLVEKEATSEKDVEEALTDRDATLVQEMFNVDADEAVSALDDDVDELEEFIEDAKDVDGPEVPADD